MLYGFMYCILHNCMSVVLSASTLQRSPRVRSCSALLSSSNLLGPVPGRRAAGLSDTSFSPSRASRSFYHSHHSFGLAGRIWTFNRTIVPILTHHPFVGPYLRIPINDSCITPGSTGTLVRVPSRDNTDSSIPYYRYRTMDTRIPSLARVGQRGNMGAFLVR